MGHHLVEFFVSCRSFFAAFNLNKKGVFMKPSKGSYRSLNGWLWEKFQVQELVEIVQQSSNLDFGQLLNRVQEGQQASNDVIQIKAFANTDTAK